MKTGRPMLVRVGLFMVIGLGLTMMAIFFIGREKNLFERRYTLLVRFSNISGLRMGAVVQLAGLNVGYVDGVRFPKERDASNLEVVLKINRAYKDRIHKDSRAIIQTQGLLGDKFISITTGSADMPPLESGDTLLSEDGSTLSALMDTGKKTMQDIQKTSQKIRETLGELPWRAEDKEKVSHILKDLEGASADLHVILAKVRSGEGTMGALLMDPSLYFDIRALLGHANRNKLLRNLIRETINDQDKATAMPIK